MQWSFWNIAGKIGQFFQESHCKFLGQSFAGLGLHDINFQYIAPFFRTPSHYATTPLISQISWLPAFFGIYIWFSLPLPTSFNQLDLQTLPLPTPISQPCPCNSNLQPADNWISWPNQQQTPASVSTSQSESDYDAAPQLSSFDPNRFSDGIGDNWPSSHLDCCIFWSEHSPMLLLQIISGVGLLHIVVPIDFIFRRTRVEGGHAVVLLYGTSKV